MMKKTSNYIICTVFLVITFVNHKITFISIPDMKSMMNFQFNIFTFSSVLAGFSFTVLGLLTGLFSEHIKEKLKNTSIITRKSSSIVRSIIWFGVSALLSILFVLGVVDFINIEIKWWNLRDFLFICEVGCIFVGLIYFLVATKGLYELIQKIFGYNSNEVIKRKETFKKSFENAKRKRAIIEEKEKQ